jgi:rapamycin-insensitive companion of mTOR
MLTVLFSRFNSSLRVALLDEAYDVRAAGLRAMRYFIINPVIGRAFFDSNQVHLVIRSLDINLDNKVERLQALRLLRHLIAVVPSEFPLSAARLVL